MTTNHDLIHKLARAIDPLAFEPDADPRRFANAIIEAEVAFEIVWDEAIEACKQAVEDQAMEHNTLASIAEKGPGERNNQYYQYRGCLSAYQAIEALKRSPPTRNPSDEDR